MSDTISDSSKKLSEIDVVSSLADDDLLVVERETTSFRVKYSSFKSYVASCLSSQLSFGSAASCDANYFALFAHGHNYTDLSFFPSYGEDAPVPVLAALCCYVAGQFDVVKYLPGYDRSTTHTTHVSVPLSQSQFENQLVDYKKQALDVGELKFIDTGKMALEDYLRDVYGAELKTYNDGTTNVDITSDSFDGFVIPNGTAFTCGQNEFKDACKQFSQSKQETATSFTVPVLSNFFKVNPGLRDTDPAQKIKGHNALLKHDHNESIQTDYQVNPLKINIGKFRANMSSVSDDRSLKANYVHWWPYELKANGQTAMSIKSININAELNSLKLNKAGSSNEVYPPYDNIAVLLYIGEL